mgnify:CR=1 FL=1
MRSSRGCFISVLIIGVLTIGVVAAGLFAVVGFVVSAAVSARERVTEFALLRALGLSSPRVIFRHCARVSARAGFRRASQP